MNETTARRQAQQALDSAGLMGSLSARDLDREVSIGLNETETLPMASLVKLPLAAATLEKIHAGSINPSQPITLSPEHRTPGPTGTSTFHHPAIVAVEDLLYLAMAVSDDTAADALFALTSPEETSRWSLSRGITGIHVRHPIAAIYDSIAERADMKDFVVLHRLVVAAERSSTPSPIPQLNPEFANAASAQALTSLLAHLWHDLESPVASQLRELLGQNLFRHRLAPDFSSDRAQWFSKTGTFLNLRHEAGVVEHDNGRRIAIAALTRSTVPVSSQPAAEAAIGRAARILHDYLLNSA